VPLDALHNHGDVLLELAAVYQLDDLKKFVEDYVAETLSTNNILLFAQLAVRIASPALFKACPNHINLLCSVINACLGMCQPMARL